MRLTETFPLFAYMLLLGAVTSYEDMRARKIKNKWILASLGFMFFFYVFVFLADDTLNASIREDIARDILLNGALSLGAGFALWKANIWPPGDAKLFFAYALLVPLPFYNNGYLPYFPSLALLINIFAAGFIYVTLTTMLSNFKISVLSQRVKNFIAKPKSMEPFKIKRAAETLMQKFLGAMTMIVLVTPLREKVFASPLSRYAFFLTLAFLFAYGFLQRFLLKTFKLWQLALIVVLYVAFGFSSGHGSEFTKYMAAVFKMSLMFMILGEGAGTLLRLYINYLGEEEAKREKDSSVSRKNFSDYVASESGNSPSNIAFAPLMFCGVLTTLVMKQSVVHYVLHILRTR